MRPATLDEVVGQEHIIGKDKLLYRAIKADKDQLDHFLWSTGTERQHRQKSLPIQPKQILYR